MTAALELRDVSVHYGEMLALEVDELRLERGRVCALIGMNGAGKSTLFRTAIGAQRPDRGTVLVDGEHPDAARRRARIAAMPQTERIDPGFPISVDEVVATGRYGHLGLTRRLRSADRAAVDEALDRVGLAELAARPIGALSGGQRKRAFLARAIAQDAELLLLDEPFAGVDRASEQTISRLLRELAADGRLVLISTHDLHAVPALADEAVLLKQRVLLHGSVAEALSPANLARAFGLHEPLTELSA